MRDRTVQPFNRSRTAQAVVLESSLSALRFTPYMRVSYSPQSRLFPPNFVQIQAALGKAGSPKYWEQEMTRGEGRFLGKEIIWDSKYQSDS